MAQAPAKAHPFLHPEYSVYIYHLPENQHEGQSDWERRSVSADLKVALDEAYRLFKSRNFKRVEVTQRHSDPYTQAVKARTVKVFDLHAHENAALRWVGLFCFLVLACFAGYWF